MTVANPRPRLFLTLKQVEAEVEQARLELGDALTKREGKGVREPGRVAQD
jgi:hypothetical protein